MGGVRKCLAPLVVVAALVASAAGIIETAAPAGASVSSAGALAIAQALASPSANVTGASFVSTTGGTPNGIADSALAGFPTNGSTFGILTSGDVNSVPNPGTFANTNNGGGSVRGNSDRDVSILKTDLNVPAGANCVAFDFKFLSEEYPQYVGSSFNDAFVAELDNSTWTTSGSAITAPDNFAFDSSGNVVSVNSTGVGGLTPANGSGTAYDSGIDSEGGDTNGAATGTLHAAHQITPGAHSVYFSIFDQGDQSLDSAVFLDNLVVGFVPDPAVNCAPGATPVSFNLDLNPPSGNDTVGTQHTVTATLTDSTNTPVAAQTIDFTVTGANPGTGSAATDANGQATFTYTGNNAGTDQIAACYDANGSPPCEAVGSATETWSSPVVTGLAVSSSLSPTTVSAGNNVVDTATVTANTAATQHNVTALVSAGPGGTVVSANLTAGSGFCSPPSGSTVTCSLGTLAPGASATISALLKTPSTPPAGGIYSATTTAHSSELPPAGVTSTATANETATSPTDSEGYVPPGGTIVLGGTVATPTDNTVARFTLPNSGPGAAIVLGASTPSPTFCGGQPCHGSTVDLNAFAGYLNSLFPPSLTLRFDASVVSHGLFADVYVQKVPGGPINLIKQCKPRPGWTKVQKQQSRIFKAMGAGPHSDYANPSPCINAKHLEQDGDLTIQVLLLSGDPKIGFK